MKFAALSENLARVREEIEHIKVKEGNSSEVRIVAVTKGHPVDAVVAAHSVGLANVGENRVQEAMDKIDEVRQLPLCWHLIGHLQTNKAKYIPGNFDLVHSVDSVRLARALHKAVVRSDHAVSLDVLVQVNVAREPQKTGCDPEEVEEICSTVLGLPTLRLRGLMTMAPFVDDERVQREVFADLRRLGERLASSGVSHPELSMGMSHDFRSAIAEGATILRLGTALFGERP
ncbi:MAG: YggS family pyridoxal phosphate-dependent enzyme [Gemmatimonadales bacterium]